MIRVLAWNEYVHEKTQEKVANLYPNGIHGVIADFLGKEEDIEVKTATLDDENCGITKELLDQTDVLIWWGHMKHHLVPDEVAAMVQEAVISGVGLICLHSAHHSKPFRLLMGTPCHLCWRESDDEELLWVVDPSHPITRGIDRYIHLDVEEMYGEPFAIPNPDKILFLSSYSAGEVFRSGCLFYRGNGKIFYFQPGHESYPTYHVPEIQTVIKNAVRYLAPTYRQGVCGPHVRKVTDEGDYVIKK